MFESLTAKGFQIQFTSHAEAIPSVDFPTASADLERALSAASIPIEEIVASGGGEAKGTQRLRRALAALGWHKANFVIQKIMNGIPKESQSHEIDHVKTFENGATVALDIEWNNKDPFFDRDLENAKRLHADGAISVGIVITLSPTTPAADPAIAGWGASLDRSVLGAARTLPSWTAVFSPHVVAVRPGNAVEFTACLDLGLRTFDAYLAMPVRLENAVAMCAAQCRYLAAQRENDRTDRMLTGCVGRSLAQAFMIEVLFPDPPAATPGRVPPPAQPERLGELIGIST